MAKPVGDSPTTEDIQVFMKSYFSDTRFGPISVERVGSNLLIFSSQTYPIQFEIEFDEDMDSASYKVYETPQPGETFSDGTKHFDNSYNPDLSWESALDSLAMAIWGGINGGVSRHDISPKD